MDGADFSFFILGLLSGAGLVGIGVGIALARWWRDHDGSA